MTRIYLPQPLSEGAQLALPEGPARHLAQVLRMRAGQTLTVFDGQGGEYAAQIEAVEKRAVHVRVGARSAPARESPLVLRLAQCVSKGERMDYAIQKAVELGVARIQPLLSERSVVQLDAARWEKKHEHWQGIVVAACEQCGRNRLPVLDPVLKLERWLPQSGTGLRLVLAPGGAALRTLPAATAASLLVGPEGGLSEAEIRRAQEAGFQRLGLGPRVLRTETAAVAALAALQTLWGDFAG